MLDANPPIKVSEQLTVLVYELLDAHDDTARLAGDRVLDDRWRVHLAYLRDLQRVGRRTLAHTCGGMAKGL